MPLEVREDASAGRHPARRDHREEAAPVEQLRRLGAAAHELEQPRVERPHVAREQLAHVRRLLVLVPQVDGRRVGGHGAVHEERHLRDARLVLELAPEEEQLLRAADRECRDEQRPAARDGGLHLALELLLGGLWRMAAIAVGAFEQEHVGGSRPGGIGEQRRAVTPQVAGEDDAGAPGGHLQEGAADDVAGAAEGDAHTGQHLDRAIEGERLQLSQRLLRLRSRVQGERGLVLAVAALVGDPRVLFLQVRAVREEQGGEVAGALGAQDAPDQALPDEPRQVSGVIDVRMRQHDRVQPACGPLRPVPVAQLAPSLEQPGIDQDALGFPRREQMPRSRHRTGGPEEGQARHPRSLS